MEVSVLERLEEQDFFVEGPFRVLGVQNAVSIKLPALPTPTGSATASSVCNFLYVSSIDRRISLVLRLPMNLDYCV